MRLINCHGCGKIIGFEIFKSHIKCFGILCWKCYKGTSKDENR